MFSDNLYFMTPAELNAYNRVNRAGNCRAPNKTDYQRMDSLMKKIGWDSSILRTSAGFRPVENTYSDVEDTEEEEN